MQGCDGHKRRGRRGRGGGCGSEDGSLVRTLDEDDDAKTGGSVFGDVEGEFQGCGGQVRQTADALERSNYGDVLEGVTAIFSFKDLGGGGWFH